MYDGGSISSQTDITEFLYLIKPFNITIVLTKNKNIWFVYLKD